MTMHSPINFRQAAFLTSASTLQQCPPEEGAEVAFAGRSNAGKSSAINRLTGNGKLARTSKTPGRTQLINFFTLGDEQLRLVDLPGYGYAKVPLAVKTRWQEHLSQYLQQRSSLRGVVLLMDIRHPLQEFDQFMVDWACQSQLPLHLLLTKSDKLKRGAVKQSVMETMRWLESLPEKAPITCQSFSALSGDGLDHLQAKLSYWLTVPPAVTPDSPSA